MDKFLRAYLGAIVMYLTYRSSMYVLITLFDMIDEIIDIAEIQLSGVNNKTVTTHSNETCKEIVNAINQRGGADNLIAVNKKRRLVNELIRKSLKPIANFLGQIIKSVPIVKKVYKSIQTLKTAIASAIAISALRIVARYDYWALIISDGLPTISIDQKAVLASIRRMRMGIKNISICLPQSQNVLEFLTDDEIIPETKNKKLIDLFSFYEMMPESHPFKNPYFVCIVHLLLSLFIINRLSFRFALKILLRLLKKGKISLETYREIINQLIVGGVSPVELEVL